ncbi:antibiotic biosynthesis monooxygenase [uncultured Roseibium sp.]|uniref:putative quinol monooxygenase n=1 Tax=uncultured Roseibium sp. TaxID=1936171 RepID=UPI00260B588B|nr:antibiotic biosynthesis monooxygenase [uncultured Roseibium sp.]
MLVALVDFTVDPSQRQEALHVLLSEVATVTAMPQCRTFRPYCDPASESHVGIVHEWQDEAGFEAYLKSEDFAKIGEVLRPLMTSAPSSRRYRATPLES